MALDGYFFPYLQVCSDCYVHMTAFWTLNSIMQFTESHKGFRKNYFLEKEQGSVDYEKKQHYSVDILPPGKSESFFKQICTVYEVGDDSLLEKRICHKFL